MTSWLVEAQGLCPELEIEGGALPGLTLQIPSQGVHCLLGGRAETREAYLKALAGIAWPQAGDLTLFGYSLADLNTRHLDLLGRQLGYVARQAPLLSVLNGRENAVMPAVYHGVQRKQAEQALEQVLAELEFDGDLLQLPAFMTPLQRMQLALARALLLQPQLLVLEDPWFSLELPDYCILDQSIRNWGQRLAVLVATDHLGFVRSNADQIIFIGADECFAFTCWQDLVASNQPEILDYLQGYRSAIDWKV